MGTATVVGGLITMIVQVCPSRLPQHTHAYTELKTPTTSVSSVAVSGTLFLIQRDGSEQFVGLPQFYAA